MPVVGTAGHVDHGKSTLVRALTGLEPDRWAEEQERGLTIDLGFAWMRLPDGGEISFVDVPGHDRFIKNMLAGVEAIDVALFVVAADEGWMPQSEEHLAVLDLLGVHRGVVALTKTDRVDSDLVELATLEVEEHLEGTSLAGSPIVPVSATEGQGLDVLIGRIVDALADLPEPAGARPRLWVDRCFSIAGAGTVVTGTLLGAPLSVGDDLTLYPAGVGVRIRGLQSHEQERDEVGPGRRVAVNVTGVNRSDVARGDMLGRPGEWAPTRRFVGTLNTARYVDDLTNRGAYHLHLGSAAYPVRIRMFGSDLVMIDLPRPMAVASGDRFILRESGRRLVVGGGRVLVPDPPRSKRFTPAVVADLMGASSPEAHASALLTLRGIDELDRLAAHSGGGKPADAVVGGGQGMDPGVASAKSRELAQIVSDYHRVHPLRPGIGIAEAAEQLGLSAAMLSALTDATPVVDVNGAVLTEVGFSVELTEVQTAEVDRVKSTLSSAGTLAVPRVADLHIEASLLHATVRRGDLVQISSEFVFLPEQIDQLTSVIEQFAEPFGVSEFKDIAGLSRKYAVPFLEWADNVGLTVRMGDKRRKRE